MIIGAGWAGGRAMTATSGPGISLMQEFIGLAYFAEVPCVFWDVCRVGPSTGLPAQEPNNPTYRCFMRDLTEIHNTSFDSWYVEECFEFGWRAFDISEQFQTPVFGLSDLDLGMNRWATTGFEYPSEDMNRGKTVETKTCLKQWKTSVDTRM